MDGTTTYKVKIGELNNRNMDLEFLTKEILPKREKEIQEGKNLATAQPIYVVLDLQENYVSGHTDITPSTNHKGLNWEYGYVDRSLDAESQEFKPTPSKMKEPKEISRFYTDRIIAFFLTSEGAHDYLQYQSHNLNNGYVYVFYSGYGNREMKWKQRILKFKNKYIEKFITFFVMGIKK